MEIKNKEYIRLSREYIFFLSFMYPILSNLKDRVVYIFHTYDMPGTNLMNKKIYEKINL